MHLDHPSDLCERDELQVRANWNQKELEIMEQNFKKGKEPSITYREMISVIEEELQQVIRKMKQLKEVIRREETLQYSSYL